MVAWGDGGLEILGDLLGKILLVEERARDRDSTLCAYLANADQQLIRRPE